MSLGTDYCTSPITSIVCLTLTESLKREEEEEEEEEEGWGWGCLPLESGHREHREESLTIFPQRPQWSCIEGGFKQQWQEEGPECFLRSHVVRKTTSLANQAAKPAVR